MNTTVLHPTQSASGATTCSNDQATLAARQNGHLAQSGSATAVESQSSQGSGGQRYLRPRYAIEASPEAYTLQVYLPGVAKDEVELLIERSVLSVQTRRSAFVGTGWRARHRELPTLDYRLRLDLNVPVNEAAVQASTENGVLKVTLPVADAARPRQIAVQ